MSCKAGSSGAAKMEDPLCFAELTIGAEKLTVGLSSQPANEKGE